MDRDKDAKGGGTGRMGGRSGKIIEICKNTKGRGNRGMASWAPRGKNTEGPSEKLGLSLDSGLPVRTYPCMGLAEQSIGGQSKVSQRPASSNSDFEQQQ